MALLKTIEFTGKAVLKDGYFSIDLNDITIQRDCYIKVNNVYGTKTELGFDVTFLENSTRENIKSQSFVFIPSVDNESTNFIKQCYEYLKTLEEFEGAVDVLEDEQTA